MTKNDDSRGAPARLLRRAAWVLVVSVPALVLAFEVLCRVAPPPGLSLTELNPLLAVQKNFRSGPHPYLAYATLPGFTREPTADDASSVHHNGLGFNGPEVTWEKPPGVYRIVCLGGSSTYGSGPSSTETNWPFVLQSELNARHPSKQVEVVNMGAPGYSTFESMINLELRGVDLKPDLVLVYHTINDMRCALYPGVNHDNTHWRAVWPVDRPSKSEALFEHSYLYLTWRRYLTDWWAERGALGSYAIVDYGKYLDDFAQATDPDLGFSNFRRNLVSIIAVARAHGAEVMLLQQACRRDDLDRVGSGPAQKDGIRRMAEILSELAEEYHTPYFDARVVLEHELWRQRAQTGTDRIFVRPEKGDGEVHLTNEGCALLAKSLADRITELELVR